MLNVSSEIWVYAILTVTGIFTGIINVMAGGGSLISLPLLIFLGLDSGLANGTNRLSIVAQNISAVAGFRSKGIGDHRFALWLAIPALPGSIAGAFASITISDSLFRKLLGTIMIAILITTFFRHKKSSGISSTEKNVTPSQKYITALCFFGIGFYTGFIQAGIGIIIIGLMSFTTGLDLVRINFYKVWVVCICTIAALCVFFSFDKIHWPMAIALAIGNTIGGWLGSHAAVLGGEKWIMRVFALAVVAMSLKLCGVF